MPTCKLYRIGNGYRYFMYCLKLSNIFCLSKHGGSFYKAGLGLGWGWGIGGAHWCISTLPNIYLRSSFVSGIYMHTLYTHACFIRCKSLANEFALSLTENIRNSNIFMFNFHNSIKKRCIKNN